MVVLEEGNYVLESMYSNELYTVHTGMVKSLHPLINTYTMAVFSSHGFYSSQLSVMR